MKNCSKIFCLLAIAAMAGSCAKELAPSTIVTGREVQASFDVSIDDATRLTLADGVFSWNSGDNVAIGQYTDGTVTSTFSTLTTSDSGTDATFAGTVVDPMAGSSWHAFFPATAVNSFNKSNTITSVTMPSVQTGSASDLGKYYMMAIYGLKKVETPSGLEKGEPLEGIKFSSTVKPYGLVPIIKLDVPETLNIKSIELSAEDGSGNGVPLSGYFKSAFKLNSGTNIFEKRDDSANKEWLNTITIERDGDVISGDVYICLMPNVKVDGVSLSARDLELANNAKILSFKFTNSEGNYRVISGIVNDGTDAKPVLTNKKVFNFGSVPSTLEFENLACTAPKVIQYNDYSADGTYTAIPSDMTFKIPEGKTISDYSYGAEYSIDGGVSWNKVLVTDGTVSGGTVMFSASIPSLSLTTPFAVRCFAYPVSDQSMGCISVIKEVPAAGDTFVYCDVGANDFTVRMKTSSGDSYSDKDFYMKSTGMMVKATGDIYVDGKMYMPASAKLKLPVIPGKILSAVILKVTNNNKNFTIKDSGDNQIVRVNNKKDYEDKSYTMGLMAIVPDSKQLEEAFLSCNMSATYKSYMQSLLICYKTLDDSAPAVKSVDPVIIADGGNKYIDFYYDKGTSSDFTAGIEYSEDNGIIWTNVSATLENQVELSSTLKTEKSAEYVARFKTTSSIPANALVRGYAYPTQKPNAKIISITSQTMPTSQLVFDFTDGSCTVNPSTESYNEGRTGIDFSDGANKIAETSTYPLTTFYLNVGGADYPANFETAKQTGNRNYAFKLDGANGLLSYKMRIRIKGIDGKKVVSMYTLNGNTAKKYCLLTNVSSSYYILESMFGDCYKVRNVAAGSEITYGSDSNTETLKKIVINFVEESEN